MNDHSRRRFLAAAITLSGTAVSPAVLRMSAAWAQSGRAADGAMVSMARLMLPHDSIPDAVYAEVLGNALAEFADSMPQSLAKAEAALNEQSGGDFANSEESIQLDALRAIQDAGYFSEILFALRLHMYNHAAAWEVIGYEGPSWQKGGYLNRGAGEIDWLPEVE